MTETEIFKAIESHYGNGILMAFADLIESEKQMNTFNTYQEAKIAMPEACICRDIVSKTFFGMPSKEGTTLSDRCEFAEAKDHCITVEKFLADGHKFVLGDIVIDEGGDVIELNYQGHTWDTPSIDDDNRYILRAAALNQTETPEEKEAFDAIEQPKPKHTKVNFVEVLPSEAVYYFTKTEDEMYAEPDESQLYDDLQDYINNMSECGASNLYRKVTTELTGREAFIEECKKQSPLQDSVAALGLYGQLFDSGKFKLIEGEWV